MTKHTARNSGGVNGSYATPSWLKAELPAEDIAAIEFITGKIVKVAGFDAYGHAELEFTDENGCFHSVWVEPYCLALL